MLEFVYDIVCPWAYLASTRVAALAEQHAVEVQWSPILLGGVLRAVGTPDRPAEAMSEPRRRMGDIDLHRWAERLGVPLNFPEAHPRRTVEAMRLVTAAPAAIRPALSADLYRAYWVEGLDVADRRVLADLARRHGLRIEAIDEKPVKDALRDSTQRAIDRGVFGVPTFFVGDTMVWGVDRMPFVEEALSGACRFPPRKPPAGRTGGRVTVYHDVASPFSYLAATQMERVAREQGALVEWVPILLGALFRTIGTADVPMMTFPEAKRRYYLHDMQEWARFWGVPFEFPLQFPIRSVLPQRAMLVEPRAMHAIYRAAWAEQVPVADPHELAQALDRAGFDGKWIVAAAEHPTIKDQLRANVDRAVAAGVCGVPSFVVDDAVLFWGQDRLDHVAAALAGWRPER